MKWAILFIIFNFPLYAIVDPPNYNFSLDSLSAFFPGKAQQEVEQKYTKGITLQSNGGQIVRKYYVEQLRYKFPVLVQIKAGIITDFFATLPTYFLHDVFFQGLINRLGKQSKYLKVENQAIYIWENKDGNQHIYEAACTITCFPVYYAVLSLKEKSGTAPLIEKYKDGVLQTIP